MTHKFLEPTPTNDYGLCRFSMSFRFL